MKSIKIVGSGCAKCNKLYDMTDQAAKELGIEYTLDKITEIGEFAAFGVMITPAMIVDDKVKLSGSVPSLEKIKQLIQE